MNAILAYLSLPQDSHSACFSLFGTSFGNQSILPLLCTNHTAGCDHFSLFSDSPLVHKLPSVALIRFSVIRFTVSRSLPSCFLWEDLLSLSAACQWSGETWSGAAALRSPGGANTLQREVCDEGGGTPSKCLWVKLTSSTEGYDFLFSFN